MVTRYNLGYGAAGANPMISRLPSTQLQSPQAAQPVTPNWQTMRDQNRAAMSQYRTNAQQANRQFNQATQQYNRDLSAYNNQNFTPLGAQTPQQYGGLLSNGQVVNRAVYDPNDPNSVAAWNQQGAMAGGNIGDYLVNRNGQQGFSSTNLAMPTAPTRQTVQAPQMQDWKSKMEAAKTPFTPNAPRYNADGTLKIRGENNARLNPSPATGGGLLGGGAFNPQANNDLMARLQGSSDFGQGNLGSWRNGALSGSSFGYDLANTANQFGMSAADFDKMINPDTYQNRWGSGGQWIGNREASTTQSPFTPAQLAQLQGTQQQPTQQQTTPQTQIDPLTGLAKLVTDKANGTWRR